MPKPQDHGERILNNFSTLIQNVKTPYQFWKANLCPDQADGEKVDGIMGIHIGIGMLDLPISEDNQRKKKIFW